MEEWKNGIVEYWNGGRMEDWNIGVLESSTYAKATVDKGSVGGMEEITDF